MQVTGQANDFFPNTEHFVQVTTTHPHALMMHYVRADCEEEQGVGSGYNASSVFSRQPGSLFIVITWSHRPPPLFGEIHAVGPAIRTTSLATRAPLVHLFPGTSRAERAAAALCGTRAGTTIYAKLHKRKWPSRASASFRIGRRPSPIGRLKAGQEVFDLVRVHCATVLIPPRKPVIVHTYIWCALRCVGGNEQLPVHVHMQSMDGKGFHRFMREAM